MMLLMNIFPTQGPASQLQKCVDVTDEDTVLHEKSKP